MRSASAPFCINRYVAARYAAARSVCHTLGYRFVNSCSTLVRPAVARRPWRVRRYTAYARRRAAASVGAGVAADLAAKEIAAQTAEQQARSQLKIAEIGHPWEPEKLAFYITLLFYYITLLFYAKCVVWDTPSWGSATRRR